MGGQIAIVGAEIIESLAHHAEVLGLFEGNLHPAVEERVRHMRRGKSRHDVECQVDRIELDMGNRVEQGDTARHGMQRTLLDLGRRHQQRLFRPAGALGQRCIQRRAQRDAPGEPPVGAFLRQFRLAVEICRTDCIDRATAHRGDRRHAARFLTAASTVSACPATFTFCQMVAMVPSLRIRNVVRSTPMKVRPYIFFSFHTP